MASKLESELSKQLSVVDALVQDLENLKTMDDHTRDEISMRFNAARNDHKEISAMLHAISVDDKGHAGVDEDEGYTEEELRRLEEEELGLKGEKEELEAFARRRLVLRTETPSTTPRR